MNLTRFAARRLLCTHPLHVVPAGKSAVWSAHLLRSLCGGRGVDSFAVGIMGDLHLEPDPQFMRQFDEARGQLLHHIGAEGPAAAGARIVQLGDLGGYTSRPGSRCVR